MKCLEMIDVPTGMSGGRSVMASGMIDKPGTVCVYGDLFWTAIAQLCLSLSPDNHSHARCRSWECIRPSADLGAVEPQTWDSDLWPWKSTKVFISWLKDISIARIARKSDLNFSFTASSICNWHARLHLCFEEYITLRTVPHAKEHWFKKFWCQ